MKLRFMRRGLTLFAALAAITACGLKTPSLDGIKDDIEDLAPDGSISVSFDASAALRALFPDLSPEEISAMVASFTADQILALKKELEAARAEATKLSAELTNLSGGSVTKRAETLAPLNDGYPTGIEPVGRAAFYSSAKQEAVISLSGVFQGKAALDVGASTVTVSQGGVDVTSNVECIRSGKTVDIVFVLDITGSMSSVIGSVRESVLRFVDSIVKSGVRGTIGVVTYQDSVGVNVTFQQPNPKDLERSPFFKPVPIDDPARVEELKRFVARLEANRGGDAPENLTAALDFARNNVIGLTANGQPNVIGEGGDDPPGTAPWPALTSNRQVFVVLTDITFHSDSRNAQNSSLRKEWKPRPIADVLSTLQTTNTVVHVSDPSFRDESTTPTGSATEKAIDADFWAERTGGLGVDRVAGYSLVDLELVSVAKDTGLIDIALDSIVSSTCLVRVPQLTLSAGGTLKLKIAAGADVYEEVLTPLAL